MKKLAVGEAARVPVKGRTFKCTEDDGTCKSTFETEKDLKKHKRTCHRYVKCVNCETIILFDSFKYSHIYRYKGCFGKLPTPSSKTGTTPANWKLSKKFIKEFTAKFAANQADAETDTTAPIFSPSEVQLPVAECLEERQSSIESASGSSDHTYAINLSDLASSQLNSQFEKVPILYVIGKCDTLVPQPQLQNSMESGCVLGVAQMTPQSTSGGLTLTQQEESDHQNNAVTSKLTCPDNEVQIKTVESSTSNSSIGISPDGQNAGKIGKRKRESCRNDERIKKRMGSRLAYFQGTPSEEINQETDDNDDSGSDDDVIARDSDLEIVPSPEQDDMNELEDTYPLQFVRNQNLMSEFLDLKFNFEENVQVIDSDGGSTNAVKSCTLEVNRALLQLLHLINMSYDESSLQMPYARMGSDVLVPILQFLQQGVGITDSEKLIKLLNDNPLKAIHAAILGLLIMSSLAVMKLKDYLHVCENLDKIEDTLVHKLTKLCCIQEFIKCRELMVADTIQLPVFIQNVAYPTEYMEISKKLYNIRGMIMQQVMVMEEDKSIKHQPRILHFDCTDAFVPTRRRNYFLENLVRNYLHGPSKNFFSVVFKLNCDPFNNEYRTCFKFNVEFGIATVRRSFYIHEFILNSRLGIKRSCSTNFYNRVQEKLNESNYNDEVVGCFWEFLHDEYRPVGWDKQYDMQQLVDLAITFQLPSVPMFLYGVELPNTPTMMKRFLSMYILANDNDGLSQMCNLILQDFNLGKELSNEQLCNVFLRDELEIKEIDVYQIITRFSTLESTVTDANAELPVEVQNKFQNLQVLIRFGTMSLDEFEQHVYEQSFLSPEISAAFRHNLFWKARGTYDKFITLPADFIKPYEPRKSPQKH